MVLIPGYVVFYGRDLFDLHRFPRDMTIVQLRPPL